LRAHLEIEFELVERCFCDGDFGGGDRFATCRLAGERSKRFSDD